MSVAKALGLNHDLNHDLNHNRFPAGTAPTSR